MRKADDIALLRRELERRGSRARIIAKIEKPQALANLDAIVAEADAVMVARGDLGVELDVIRVPAIQKQIIDACHRARVPVITATQMLNSMESSSRPNPCRGQRRLQRRARRHRCRDALGRDGDRSIPRRIRRHDEPDRRRGRDICCFPSFAPAHRGPGRSRTGPAPTAPGDGSAENHGVARAGRVQPITESVVEAASLISRRLNAALLVVATSSGRTALVLSKQRNSAPTLAVANDPQTARAMALFWGVTPLPRPDVASRDELRAFVLDWCRRKRTDRTGRSHRRHPRLAVR